jgi:hypothetical protein
VATSIFGYRRLRVRRVSEFMLRFIVWLSSKDNTLSVFLSRSILNSVSINIANINGSSLYYRTFNRNRSDFACTLKDNHVDLLVDVRRYPRSRACPQFNKKQMITYLQKKSVSYIHIEKLGGRRNKLYTKGDRHTDNNNNNNAGWRNKSFGAYANYMATTSFRGRYKRIIVTYERV